MAAETRMWSFVGKKLNVFRTGMACCVSANEAGSQRPGSQNLNVTWWLNRLDPQKSMHPPFSDKCHPTIFSSPRSFAAFSFLRPPFLPKPLVVPWFSTICQHFPSIFQPFFVVPRPLHCFRNYDVVTTNVTTWAEARAWERTPEQPPAKRARCVGWFAWRRKWGPPGDGLVGGGFSSNFICFL